MQPISRQPRRHQLHSVASRARSGIRSVVAVCVLALALAVAPDPVRAHVQIDVGDGRYVVEIGFRDEPAYLGQPNALALRVEEFATGGTQPVEGLAATLAAEVSKNGQTMSLPLVPRGDGAYEGRFVPTALGDYTFHLTGTIGDVPIDETVTSGPTTFNAVEPLSSIEFPVRTPDAGQLAADAAAAKATAETARAVAIAGLGAAVLGLIVGAVGLARARRTRVETEVVPSAPTGKLIR